MPDEETLALWVDDELSRPTAAKVDRWAETQPEWLKRREQARALKPLISAALPAAEEPPYAEFFNARIAREVAREAAISAPAAPAKSTGMQWWRWFLPATAVVGMALCFWGGIKFSSAQESSRLGSAGPLVHPSMPIVYTPEKGVNAAYFSSAPADAMVIVLDGVSAIPDSFEIPETAFISDEPNHSTAGMMLPTP